MEFATTFVIVGVQGAKTTSGYGIEFTSLKQFGNRVYIQTLMREPMPDEAVDLEYLADNLWIVGSPATVAERILDKGRILFGVGVVENDRAETADIAVLDAESLVEGE